jgi:hypothetical protein
MSSSPDIPVSVPERGNRRDLKHWVLAELFGWRCVRGHIVLRGEEEVRGLSYPITFNCVDCEMEFWRTRKANIRKLHNSVRPLR